jgi:conjugative transposon TraJ protein
MAYLIDISGDLGGLQATLQTVRDTMIVHCSDLIGISSAIAGFGTLWYVAAHIWMRLSRNEPVEIEPLYRPLAIGISITLFPYVIALINGVMQPTADGTAAIFNDSNQAVATLLQQKEQALQQSSDWQMYVSTTGSGSLEKWEELSGEADSGIVSGVSNRVKFEMAKASYNIKNSVKVWLSEILQVLYEAAALCINTVRTFYMVILAILGPLAFGFSVYPGLEDSLGNWLGRYLHVYLWLPVANIFGSLLNQIQQEMIRLDIAQLGASGQTSFSPTDAAYIIFLVMGIVGYFTVPSITHYIVRSAGVGAKLWRTNLT